MEKIRIINEIGKAIAERILNQANLDINEKDSLISSGLIDSFNLVDLALIVEDLYTIRIEDYELNSDTFDNLDELAELITQKMEG